jgi:hypothetical protein
MKIGRTILAVAASGAWISVSEFARNQLVFQSYWLEKYKSLGVVFPSQMINGAMWGVWSMVLAGAVVYLLTKMKLIQAIIVAWVMAFVMMWVVIGNLDVLPYGLLLFAVPWSIVEVTLAALIAKGIAGKRD